MNKQSGSAIFIILIAVALFAALGYAFMRGNRGSTAIMTDEAAKAYAGQIIAYGNDIRSSVKRMNLRGIKDTDLSFDNSVYQMVSGNPLHESGHNPNCTLDNCRLFSTSGGQINPIQLPEAAFLYYGSSPPSNFAKPGALRFRVIGLEGSKSSQSDLFVQFSFVKKEVCQAINKILNYNFTDDIPAQDTYDISEYDGTYPSLSDPIGNTVVALKGKSSFCIPTSDPNNYAYYQLLIDR